MTIEYAKNRDIGATRIFPYLFIYDLGCVFIYRIILLSTFRIELENICFTNKSVIFV